MPDEKPVEKEAPKRSAKMVGCPGCTAVDTDGKECAPGNLNQCTISQSHVTGWKPGACLGCKRLAAKEPCASGNAALCAVAWSRNR